MALKSTGAKPAATKAGAAGFEAEYTLSRETKGTFVFERDGLTKETRFSGSNSIYLQKADYPDGPPKNRMRVIHEFID